MSEFGSCTEPSCQETSARLFVCVHHCKKLVCLQHLIEHDQMIEQDDGCRENLRNELEQLWTSYSSLVDENKLRLEFEQRLNRYQQFIKEISNVFEKNSTDIEKYRSMIEKIQLNIEQEKQMNPSPNEILPQIDQVKTEPCEISSTYDEFEDSLTNRLERINSSIQPRSSISYDSPANNDTMETTEDEHDDATPDQLSVSYQGIQSLACECPFWENGAFGLREDVHGIHLCARRKYAYLYGHLIHYHKLKPTCVELICRSIRLGKNPSNDILFQQNDIVIDKHNNYLCPFSIYNPKKNTIFKTTKYSCRRVQPTVLYSLKQHFICQHHMSPIVAKNIVNKLKIQSKDEDL